MKYYRLILSGVILTGILTLSACDNFLNVEPKDKYLEKQVFKNEQSVQSTINGIYANMASEYLYGEDLTMSTLEVLGQNFQTNNISNDYEPYGNYEYEDGDVQNSMSDIWEHAYNTILNINKLIESLGNTKEDIISDKRKNIILGEAYGLRAFIHFDILRLFGPLPTQKSKPSIPYYSKISVATLNPIPQEEVISKVLKDLDKAEELLSNDSIIENGVHDELEKQGDDFYKSYRDLRMNYYAVLAMKARVHLWAGNDSKAFEMANQVINKAKDKFPWVKPEDILNNSYPDLIFPTEVIFAIQDNQLPTRFEDLYSSQAGISALKPSPSVLPTIFDGNKDDYRFRTWFKLPEINGSDKLFVKYGYTDEHVLIRISEMYLIAAETARTKKQSIKFINILRNYRGLKDLAKPVNDLKVEITKEYRREFYGEGQLFYYYKRRGFKTIPSGNYSSVTISMGPDKYVVPTPKEETKYQH